MPEDKRRTKKLLDQWLPPEHAGKPIGCLSTTFTFSAALFEEQCLSNFLAMDSEPNQDGALYLIEREEKMSGLCGTVVMVDSRHISESHSLRWDVIPARVAGGCQHAKVSLLVWQGHIRIIIASANLTEQGYCKNQEVFGVLDYEQSSTFPRQALVDVLNFLEALPDRVSVPKESSVVERWQAVIAKARQIGVLWGADEADLKISIQPIFVVPKGPNIFDQIRAAWESRGGIARAYVKSPFFDTEEAKAEITVNELTRLLNARNVERTISWYTTAEKAPEEERWLMHIPRASQTIPERKQMTSRYRRIGETPSEAEGEPYRPLHAKAMWFEGQRWSGFLCGSSNFTQRGTGLSIQPNIEANLIYLFREDVRGANKNFNQAWIHGDKVKSAQLGFGELKQDDSEDEDMQTGLPLGFQDAVLVRDDTGELQLQLMFAIPPEIWSITFGEPKQIIATHAQWQQAGRPEKWVIHWRDVTLPSILQVSWGNNAHAYWPVNIADASLLPPPEDLKNLSLDALIEILSSQGSLRDAMRKILRRKQAKGVEGEGGVQDDLDPHKRIQTSHYLIPRTQRISRALTGLRERLQRPVATEEALLWRLDGPIGVKAVVKALRKHTESKDELAFLMSELVLDMGRIHYQAQDGSLDESTYYQHLIKMINKLIPQMKDCGKEASPAIYRYCQAVVKQGLTGKMQSETG
ncbi:MAG: hypothetical protein BMS9Abin36_1391 [Gammaproteobacteria bacterium]|nr:MAG: hypothetical protein BMS9Abin36_1391 [Gammaproteobacteria bacterium]